MTSSTFVQSLSQIGSQEVGYFWGGTKIAEMHDVAPRVARYAPN